MEEHLAVIRAAVYAAALDGVTVDQVQRVAMDAFRGADRKTRQDTVTRELNDALDGISLNSEQRRHALQQLHAAALRLSSRGMLPNADFDAREVGDVA